MGQQQSGDRKGRMAQPHAPGHHTKKHVTYDAAGNVVKCLFCDIADGKEANSLWYKDELVSVFIPRAPAATLHLLVIPNAHVKNTSTLTAADLPLLDHMKRVGLGLLKRHAPYFSVRKGKLPNRAHPPPYSFHRGSHMEALVAAVKRRTAEEEAAGLRAAATGAASHSHHNGHHHHYKHNHGKHDTSKDSSGKHRKYQHQPLPEDVEDYRRQEGAWSALRVHAAGSSVDTSSEPPPLPSVLKPLEDADLPSLRHRLCYHRAPSNSVDHLHLHVLLLPFFSVADSLHFLVGSPWTWPHDSLVEHLRRTMPLSAHPGKPIAFASASGGAGSGAGSSAPVPPSSHDESSAASAPGKSTLSFMVDEAVMARAAEDVAPLEEGARASDLA